MLHRWCGQTYRRIPGYHQRIEPSGHFDQQAALRGLLLHTDHRMFPVSDVVVNDRVKDTEALVSIQSYYQKQE